MPTPQVHFSTSSDSVVGFLLTQATAERSERYISSLARTDLGVPLEVEFEETLSSGADGDTISRHVSAPGVVYSVQIWSINGASFSKDPLIPTPATLLFEEGKKLPAYIDIVHLNVVECDSRDYSTLLHSTLNSSHCPSTAVHHSQLL